jgi:hypothetical protein
VTSESKFVGTVADLQVGDVFTHHGPVADSPRDVVRLQPVRVVNARQALSPRRRNIDVVEAEVRLLSLPLDRELTITRGTAAPGADAPPASPLSRLDAWVEHDPQRTVDISRNDEGWEVRLYLPDGPLGDHNVAGRGASASLLVAVSAAFEGVES